MYDYELRRVAHEAIAEESRVGLAELSRPRQVVFLVWCFAGQVDNGGLSQFLFNSTGAYAHETVAALQEAGCPVAARILTNAIELFSNGVVPVELDERNAALLGLPSETDAQWEAFDREYFATESKTAYDRLWAYWNAATAA